MVVDIRDEVAKHYDLWPMPFDDIPFYKERVPSPDAAVLELGCGTGRVLMSLASCCGYIHGLDISKAMLSICREKLRKSDIPSDRAYVETGDITNFALGRKFDLIIAPYRVFQNLETNEEVERFFGCVRKHLSSSGSCILNVFNPNMSPDELRREWAKEQEKFHGEVFVEGRRITYYDRWAEIDPEKLILYPELIFRTYEGDVLKHEDVLKVPMRCYYPNEFDKLIVKLGFKVIHRWGGYANEPYGQGEELVIQFIDGECA